MRRPQQRRPPTRECLRTELEGALLLAVAVTDGPRSARSASFRDSATFEVQGLHSRDRCPGICQSRHLAKAQRREHRLPGPRALVPSGGQRTQLRDYARCSSLRQHQFRMNLDIHCRHGVQCRALPSQQSTSVRPSRRRPSAPRSNGAWLRPDEPLASGSSLTGWQALDRREWNQDDAVWVAEQTSRQVSLSALPPPLVQLLLLANAPAALPQHWHAMCHCHDLNPRTVVRAALHAIVQIKWSLSIRQPNSAYAHCHGFTSAH